MDTTAVMDLELRIKERREASREAARTEIRRLAQEHMEQMIAEGWRMCVDGYGNKTLEPARI